MCRPRLLICWSHMVGYDRTRVCPVAPFVRLFDPKYASPTRETAFKWNVRVFQTVSEKVYHAPIRPTYLSLNTTTSLKAKSEDEPASHLQSHVYKEKDKAKLKRKDDKAYRAPPKQLLGEIDTHQHCD